MNFSTQKTMRLAQQLYEGVELKGGTAGIITYLRTDSTRVSEEAQTMAKAYISEKFADVIATKNKGLIMKTVMSDIRGKADGKDINRAVSELI